MIWSSGGSKSRFAKAAGAEPAGQMRDEKLHAVVARSTYASEKAKNTALLRGEANGKYVWRGRFARGGAGGLWRCRMWRCRMRRCRWAWRSRLELCVARPVPREWPSTTRTMEKKRFFTRKQKFRKVSFREENKSFPPGLSVWRKTNKKLFFKKVCFWKENKRFLKRFISTRKTNSGPTSLKQKFAGKQTNKNTWKNKSLQGNKQTKIRGKRFVSRVSKPFAAKFVLSF